MSRAAWARLAGPVVQLSTTGSLPASDRPGRRRRRRPTPAASGRRLARQAAEPPRHGQGADQQPFVGEHAGQVVGRRHVARIRARARATNASATVSPWMSSGPPSDGGRNQSGGGGSAAPSRPAPGPAPRICPRVAGTWSPEKPNRCSTAQGQLHAIEAVQAELVERGVGVLLAVGQRPAQLLREDLGDRGFRRSSLTRPTSASAGVEAAGTRGCAGRRGSGTARTPAVPAPRRCTRLRARGSASRAAVPAIPRGRLRRSVNVPLAARHQHDQVGKQPAGADKQTADQRRLAPGEGVAEPAAPQAARPHQDGRGLWNGLEDVSDGSCGAEAFQAAAPQSPRRPDDVVCARPSGQRSRRRPPARSSPAPALASWRTGTSTASSSFMNGKRRGLRKSAP